MPKSRGSGIASGGSGSMDQNGGADRLGDRLNQIMTINVPTYSNSRGRTEDTQVTFDPSTPEIATVDSESGARYQVNHPAGTCTCPHNRIRGARCRHIDAVDRALGQVGQSPSSGPLNIDSAINTQAQADIEAEQQRRELQNILEDDNYFYSDNEQEFQRNLEAFRNAPLPYEYENVLNGSQNTFGLEIEFVGGDADSIARELHSMGICGYDRRMPYHSRGVPDKWRLERDGSVSDGSGGGELVSPVLRDTPETWQTLQRICEVAKRHGARIDNAIRSFVDIAFSRKKDKDCALSVYSKNNWRD